MRFLMQNPGWQLCFCWPQILPFLKVQGCPGYFHRPPPPLSLFLSLQIPFGLDYYSFHLKKFRTMGKWQSTPFPLFYAIVNVCVNVHMCAHAYTCVSARGWCQVSSPLVHWDKVTDWTQSTPRLAARYPLKSAWVLNSTGITDVGYSALLLNEW